ncbi:MAG: type II CRISPR RNA-guided endonuclease Cas9 [Desulfitobacteriaceae bacterium]
MREIESYSIGIDIGTNSVGYAVTDVNNKLLKFKKSNMWGVNLFDEGQTAKTTRLARGMRRRITRRKNRIALLQELLAEDVLKADEHFYLRMKESSLYKEDKSSLSMHTLFSDREYSDVEYYKQFPTIYHLRQHLLQNDEKCDIRLIYLTLHHMIKYRGNFLYEGQSFAIGGSKIDECVYELFKVSDRILSGPIVDKSLAAEKTVFILSDSSLYKADKEKKLIESITVEKEDKDCIKQIIKAILGYKADYTKVFDLETSSDFAFKLSDEDADVKLQDVLQDRNEIFEAIYKVYSTVTLAGILQGEKTLSSAMIAKYQKHTVDLMKLKKLFKQHFKSEYSKMFRNKEDFTLKNYTNYITGEKKCDKFELYAAIKKILATKKNLVGICPEYDYCMTEIENDTFINKQTSKDNAAIPYQLNEQELVKILEKQAKYYPSIEREKNHIAQILSFRIPYYVGPLNYNPKNKRKFDWMERKIEKQKIYPWNFFEVVDQDMSAERFITRMTNHCTYLKNEDVIPKQSLLYAEYEMLNEVNKIRKNGELLSIDTKKKLIVDLFQKQKNISEKTFIKWLKENQVTTGGEIKVEGYQKDGEFASSLTAYIDFTNILGSVNSGNS